MPIGAGSIKRAAKLNAEGNKTVNSKKNEGEEKAEVKNTEDKKAETIETKSKTAAKKTSAKKATPKKVVKKAEIGPRRLGSEPVCHVTEEMPIHLL